MQFLNMRISEERISKLEALQSLGPFPATKTSVIDAAIDALFRQLIAEPQSDREAEVHA